jgi:hypothetical protein
MATKRSKSSFLLIAFGVGALASVLAMALPLSEDVRLLVFFTALSLLLLGWVADAVTAGAFNGSRGKVTRFENPVEYWTTVILGSAVAVAIWLFHVLRFLARAME